MNEPKSPTDNASELEAQQRRKELYDLKSLQRVHLVVPAAEAKSLTQSSSRYMDMPVESQIYFRNIVDKFPGLPRSIAEWSTRSWVSRKDRLKGLRKLYGDAPQDLGIRPYCQLQAYGTRSIGFQQAPRQDLANPTNRSNVSGE